MRLNALQHHAGVKPVKAITTPESVRVISPVLFGRVAVPKGPDGPAYGTLVNGQKVTFSLWAPRAKAVDLVILRSLTPEEPKDIANLEKRIIDTVPMEAQAEPGSFAVSRKKTPPGSLYMYRLHLPDGTTTQLLPDPRSRFQPEDVHGPSQVVAPDGYAWASSRKRMHVDPRKLIPYRLHVGTFTPGGRFSDVIDRLDYIQKELGYNAIELMPVQEFAGRWNWGYDMVSLFAPENAYGRPEDLKKLVDAAHQRGMTVVLDVVYNHLGPEGNYLKSFDPHYTSAPGPWGDRFHWKNPKAMSVVTDNLRQWVDEFRIDMFRFDMANMFGSHDSETNEVLGTIGQFMRKMEEKSGRPIHRFAEDPRPFPALTRPVEQGGLGFTAQYSFPFHHRLKSVITGQSHMGSSTEPGDLSWVLENGDDFPHQRESLHRSVHFFESHDEIGNHDGRRAIHKTSRDRYLLGSLLKYALPGVPRNFMGEEYGEKNPFYFFVDFSDTVCVNGVKSGRKSAPQPDCIENKEGNFQQSKLSWDKDPGILAATRDMIRLRKTIPSLWQGDQRQMTIDRSYLGSRVLAVHRRGVENPQDESLIIMNFSNFGYSKQEYGLRMPPGQWREVFNSADQAYQGPGPTNHGAVLTPESSKINLPAWSMAVFTKIKS